MKQPISFNWGYITNIEQEGSAIKAKKKVEKPLQNTELLLGKILI
ncbi:MAG: hypothetical protein WA395_13360 [Nitrososphaeraceae archaeon]|jgi:hypothetical protein